MEKIRIIKGEDISKKHAGNKFVEIYSPEYLGRTIRVKHEGQSMIITVGVRAINSAKWIDASGNYVGYDYLYYKWKPKNLTKKKKDYTLKIEKIKKDYVLL